jgi:hypothetical protein
MDNDLDVSVIKAGTYPVVREVYRNNGGGNYASVNTMTCSSCPQDIVVADFDRDGDEDVIRNAGGAYQLHLNTPQGLVVSGLSFSSYSTGIAITDFNSDGLPDVVLLSYSYQSGGKIYKNLGPQDDGTIQFEALPVNLSSGNPSLLSADFDHDGKTDLVVLSPDVNVLLNKGGDTFDQYILPEFRLGLHIGGVIDFDNDGDLDIFLSGYHVKDNSVYGRKGKILLNQTIVSTKGIPNAPPEAPHDLVATQDSLGVHLSWGASGDDHTSPQGITYDVVLFRNGEFISKADHDPATGRRFRLSRGRSTGISTMNNLSVGQYSWRVQAIDGSFAASGFSAEGTFEYLPAPPVINDTVIYKCGRTITIIAKGTGIKWYADKELAQLIASGEFHPDVSQTVYAVQTVDGYRGIPKRVRITIYEKPPVPEFSGANPLIVCDGGDRWLWVAGENVRWYSDQSLTRLLSSTNELRVPSNNATYYVTQGVQGCVSDPLALQVQTATIDPRIYATDERIWTKAKDGEQFVWFRNGWYFVSTTVPYIPFDGQTATYVVLVVKGQCQVYSEPFISSENNITGIEERSELILDVFPNPASSYVTIRAKGTGKAINIYDTMGKLVYSSSVGPEQEQVINTSQWNKGVYVIVWNDEKVRFMERLILF